MKRIEIDNMLFSRPDSGTKDKYLSNIVIGFFLIPSKPTIWRGSLHWVCNASSVSIFQRNLSRWKQTPSDRFQFPTSNTFSLSGDSQQSSINMLWKWRLQSFESFFLQNSSLWAFISFGKPMLWNIKQFINSQRVFRSDIPESSEGLLLYGTDPGHTIRG